MLTEYELMRGYSRGREAARSSDEESLLQAITDALSLTGWTWQHIRRSDLAIVQGTAGFPDLIAIRDGTLLAIECKTETGRPTYEQVLWLRSFRSIAGFRTYALIVRPTDLDELLLGITGKDADAYARIADRTWHGDRPVRDPELDKAEHLRIPPGDRLQRVVDGIDE